LSNAIATCKDNCNDVVTYIQMQFASLGCTAPDACSDYGTLNKYWVDAQRKAGGLEPVYVEGWVIDAKAVLDLGKFGIRLATGVGSGATSSLDALNQLGKVDVQAAAKMPAGANASGSSLKLASGEVGPVGKSLNAANDANVVAANGALILTSDIAPTTKGVAQYGPIGAPGPLPLPIANTFRSGTYAETVTTEPTVLYRVYGGTGNQLGGYWTTTPPSGPVQSIIDSALNPVWGNPATLVVKIEVPPGVTLYQGKAAAQGGLVGGGNQVLFGKNITINPAWIRP
jgi:filamentous hemagglutinin